MMPKTLSISVLILIIEIFLTHFKLKTALAIIFHNNAKQDRDNSKKTTNIRKHIIKFSKLSVNVYFAI
jgi:hypothetical protein